MPHVHRTNSPVTHLRARKRAFRAATAGVLPVLLLLGSPEAIGGSRAQGNLSRPNILFIFSDDHGAQAISSYGSYRNRTPAIDRLAREGMRFLNCFCTNAICAPSRATILTGLHTHRSGHTTNERLFDSRLETFPAMLRHAGYQTALVGKWHLNSEPEGFDYWDILINQGTYYNPPMIRNGSYVDRVGYTTDIITDLTIDWLEKERDPARPFLLMSHHKAPHRSWEPALRHLGMFEGDSVPEPPTLFDDWSGRSSAWSHAEMSIERHLWPGDLHLIPPSAQLNAEQLAAWDSVYEPRNKAFREAKLAGIPLVRWKYQRYAKDYLRTIAAVDESVGRILAYLDTTGLAASTVVIYSSDQGWYLGEHGMYDKRWMYEESLRMPLLVRWPGMVAEGVVNHDLVQNLDFAATFLDLAGVSVPGWMQGRSLVPLLSGKRPADWRGSVYYHYYEDHGAHNVPRHYGVRTDRYKLIHYYLLDEWELFDLQADPDELSSLYGKPEFDGVTARLKAELARLRAEAGVTSEADSEYETFTRQKEARWRFLSLLGRLPPRLVSGVEQLESRDFDGYRREKIGYKIGDQRIEAFVLVPLIGTGPFPAVLLVHPGPEWGDGAAGKSLLAGAGGDRRPALGPDLSRRGYVVMIPDRYGFESRRQPPGTGGSRGPGTEERARSLIVSGSTFLGQELNELWFAETYLSRRPEVHTLRVGVVGCGEGALLGSLLGFLNEGIAATVAADTIPGFAEILNARAGPQGSQRRALLSVPGILGWGELDDVVAGVYPRPYLLAEQREVKTEVLHKARSRYNVRNYDARLGTFERRTYGRDLTQKERETICSWLDRWLKRSP